MKPAERRAEILELLKHGAATVNWLARSLHMMDQPDLIVKDLQTLKKAGLILLYHARHIDFRSSVYHRWPTQITLLVATLR
jgi:DeoR/GlpR family transcriptional regulator of sugar metabolism